MSILNERLLLCTALCGFLLASPALAEEKSDHLIAEQIRQELKRDGRLKDIPVEIKVSSGEVVLSGEVPLFQDRLNIARAAREVEGVERVWNRITVRGLVASGPQVAKDLQRRFDRNVIARTLHIKVEFADHHVILQGTVGSETRKRQAESFAERYAAGIPIRNQIEISDQVTDTANPTVDQLLQMRLTRLLRRDDLIQGQPIFVDVRNNTATLWGNSETDLQRERAEAIARRVTRLSEIHNKIDIGEQDRGPTHEAQATRKTSDDEASQKALSQIQQELRENAKDITVIVDDGFAVIRGAVANEGHRRIAALAAMKAEGVSWIDNQLVVRVRQ